MIDDIRNLAQLISPLGNYLFSPVANKEQLMYYWTSCVFLAVGLLLAIILIINASIKIKNSRLNVVATKEIMRLIRDCKSGQLKINRAYTDLIFILKEILNNRFKLNLNSMTDDETLESVISNDKIENEFKTFLEDLISKVKVIKFSDLQEGSKDFEDNAKKIVFFIEKWFK